MSGASPIGGGGVGSDVGLDELNMPPDSLIHIKADGKGESILDVAGAIPLLSQGATTKPVYGRVIIPGLGTPLVVKASATETGTIHEWQDSVGVVQAHVAFNGHWFVDRVCFEGGHEALTQSGTTTILKAGTAGDCRMTNDFGSVNFGAITGFFQIPVAVVIGGTAVGPDLGGDEGGFSAETGSPTKPRFTDNASADHTLAMLDVATTWTQDHIFNGNVTIQGETITATAEVLLADNHIVLNSGYSSDPAQTAGLVAVNDPTTTTDTVATDGFTAGVPSSANPFVKTVGAATFSPGDIVQFDTTNDPGNNGIREVLTHAGGVLTIRGIGVTATVEDFTQNQFVTDATVAGNITKVNVSVSRAGLNGIWETAQGAVTGFVFVDYALLAGQLGGSATAPDVRGIRETGGPTLLAIAGIADGEFLKRVGSTIVGTLAPAAAPAVFRASSEGESTTTSTSFQEKVKLTFLAEAADYLVEWSAEAKISAGSQSAVTQFEEDDTTQINEPFVNVTDYMTIGGFKVVPLTAANHDFDIDFRSTAGTATASIRRARITATKIVAG